jgi:hypothetical protein
LDAQPAPFTVSVRRNDFADSLLSTISIPSRSAGKVDPNVLSARTGPLRLLDGGLEVGRQPRQIESVAIGHLLQRVEKCLATDAFTRAPVPCPEHGFGGPVPADDVKDRQAGLDASPPYFNHPPSLHTYEFEIKRDIFGNQIAINDPEGVHYR